MTEHAVTLTRYSRGKTPIRPQRPLYGWRVRCACGDLDARVNGPKADAERLYVRHAAADYVWRAVAHRGARGRWSWGTSAHLCRVDHTYGPDGIWRWLVPVCSVRAGREDGAIGDQCKRCVAWAERMGLPIGADADG